MAKPYIPEKHKKYNLLPMLHEDGGEVFSYPHELSAIEDALVEAEGLADKQERTCILVPYGMGSYDEYYTLVQEYADKHRESNPDLAVMLEALIEIVKAMNVKEDWSVLRYIGDQFEGDQFPNLTKGRCYYWPCSRLNPVYEGVIDNEEFTSYLYPCDPNSWEILEDPTGMAAQALAEGADDGAFWKIGDLCNPDPIEAWVAEKGLGMKEMIRIPMLDAVFDDWGDSDIDDVSVTCPSCGNTYSHGAWTRLNAKNDPEMAEKLYKGTLFDVLCPECGTKGNIVHPCLFLDSRSGVCIYYVLSEDFARGAEDMFDSFSEKEESTSIALSKKRIVTSREALREKAIAFTEGLNDGALELLKFGISGQLKMDGRAPLDSSIEVHLIEVEDDKLVFRLKWDTNSLIAETPMQGLELFSDALEKAGIYVPENYYVDRAWASETIDILNALGVLD